MMTQPQSNRALFQALLERQYRQVQQQDALEKMRSRAWDHFLEMGLPTRKTEVFRYIKLHRFFSREYELANPATVSYEEVSGALLPECENSALVFVNGRFQPHLSRLSGLSKRVVILPLQEAFRTYGTFLNHQWMKSIKEETDPFAILNTVLHQDGVFLYLPPKTIEKTPLQILHLTKTPNDLAMMSPRIHAFIGSQSQLDVYMNQETLEGRDFCLNIATEFSLEEDSHVRYMQTKINIPGQAWVFDALRTTLKKNSSLKTIQITYGSETVRHDYRVALTGENAEATLSGMWMLDSDREAHTHIVMDHQAPYCRSMQNYKGVLNGESQSSFEGKILVRQVAQKTEAYQVNHNIVLSENASAKSKPNLEIFADDVKASHGATVGQLDQEQLFYMKTRGFKQEQAKNLLIYGFCKEIIHLIPLPSLRKKVALQAQQYVTQGNHVSTI